MDFFAHAVAGAATGAAFGHPLLGAVVAVLPDSALWRHQRPPTPPCLYKAAHSGLAAITIPALCLGIFDQSIAETILWAWLSHIVLDIPTHGTAWAPRLLWPNEKIIFRNFNEWEWFNHSWWTGLGVTFIWSMVWINIVPQ